MSTFLDQLKAEFGLKNSPEIKLVKVGKRKFSLRKLQIFSDIEAIHKLIEDGFSESVAILSVALVGIDSKSSQEIFSSIRETGEFFARSTKIDLVSLLFNEYKSFFNLEEFLDAEKNYCTTEVNSIITGDQSDAVYVQALRESADLRRLVHICIKLGRLPTERDVRNLTSRQIRLLFYAIREDEERSYRRVEKTLGTYWEYYDIWPAHTGEEEEVGDHIRVPLSLVLRPELLKNLKNQPIMPPGGKLSIPGSGITEGADLSKSEFLKLMSGAVAASADLQKKREEESSDEVDEGNRRNRPTPKVPRQNCPSCLRSPKGVCPLHADAEDE